MKIDPFVQRIAVGVIGCIVVAVAELWLKSNATLLGFGTFAIGYSIKSHWDAGKGQ